jgi:hypothetical protein
MLLNENAFNGSKRAIHLAQHLRVIAGNATWFPRFDPFYIPFSKETFLLQRELFRGRLCFFLTGSFVYFSAGIFNGFHGASLFIALTDTPLNSLLFQRGDDGIDSFWINGFKFHLLEPLPDAELFNYESIKGSFYLKASVFGVDVSAPAGVLGSVDLIRFVRTNFETSYHKRYAFIFIPSNFTEGDPMLLCLKYYRAGAYGRKDSTDCTLCVSEYRTVTRHLTGCALPRACACNICSR